MQGLIPDPMARNRTRCRLNTQILYHQPYKQYYSETVIDQLTVLCNIPLNCHL